MKVLSHKYIFRSMLLAGGAFAPGIAGAQTQATEAEDASDRSGVADIIVTAQKREQNLQDVPISITALNQDMMVANRIADVRDLTAVAPSLSVRVVGGGSNSPSYTLRGLATAGTAPGSDKGVGIYLDGVYLHTIQGSVFSVAEVERIEVLKGPQGTLFGRNATGGAISIITREPPGEFGFRQELSYGNYDQFRSRTRVDLPKFGPLSLSASYLHTQRRGDIRNLGAGTTWDYGPSTGGRFGKLVSPEYLGDENMEAFFVAAKLDLSDRFVVTYKFDYTDKDYTPVAQGVAYLYPDQLGPNSPLNTTRNLLTVNLAAQNPALATPITSQRPDAVNNAFTLPSHSRVSGHNLTARYELTDEISVKNVLAFRKASNTNTSQLDGLGGLVNVLPFGPVLTGAPIILLGNTGESRDSQWSNEFQVNINTQWFSLTAGYLHFDMKNVTGGFEGPANVTQFGFMPGYVIPTPAIPNRQSRINMTSDAWFLQPEIHLTPQLDIVAGARITVDRKTGVDNSSLAQLGSVPVNYRNSQPTYLVGLNYRPTDGILTYAKFATGYISGGRLAGRDYDPEKSTSYEVGVKADLFNRRLRANLAVYSVDYENIQITTLGNNITPPLPGVAQVVVNAGNARVKGFEFESTLVPIDGLTLTANVGYADFKYKSFLPFLATFGNLQPTRNPKWTGNTSIQYESAPVIGGGHLVFRLDANYRSEVKGAQSFPNAVFDAAATIPASWIVNGRAALADFDIAGSKAELAVWGRNILDNRNFSELGSLGFVIGGNYERARTFGVDLNFEF